MSIARQTLLAVASWANLALALHATEPLYRLIGCVAVVCLAWVMWKASEEWRISRELYELHSLVRLWHQMPWVEGKESISRDIDFRLNELDKRIHG